MEIGGTIPAVMFLEMAMDMLKNRDAKALAAEVREFRLLGPGREAEIRQTLDHLEPQPDMAAGYLLGLETARAILATNVEAARAGVAF